MSEVKSKVPGVVDEVKAAVGDKIEKGQPVVILEAALLNKSDFG